MRKKINYPEEAEGAVVRKLANNLTQEEEAEHFRHGMAKFMAASQRNLWRLLSSDPRDAAIAESALTSSKP
jgi:hypothetical protein